MTEYKKCGAEVASIKRCVEQMLSETVAGDVKMEALISAKKSIEAVEGRLAKMRKKAEEKDPEKMTYGEGMTKKVLVLCAEFEEVSHLVEETEAHVRAHYKPFEERLALDKTLREEEALQAADLEKERLRELELQREAIREEQKQAMLRAEEERAARYKAACEAAEVKKMEDLAKIEEEKRQRAKLEAYLNRTPTRMLLHRGIKRLFVDCKEEKVNLRGIHWLRAFDDCIRSLHQFTKNLSGHPDSLPLKHLRYTNENFNKDVLSRGAGALHVLYSLGYRPAGFGESQFLVLEEIDPLQRYEEWEAWWEEVKWTRDYLQRLIDSLRNHRRGVAQGEYDLNPNLPEISGLELIMQQPDAPLMQQSNEAAMYT